MEAQCEIGHILDIQVGSIAHTFPFRVQRVRGTKIYCMH